MIRKGCASGFISDNRRSDGASISVCTNGRREPLWFGRFLYQRAAVRNRLREDLQNKTSGLNLVVAAIVLWNTVPWPIGPMTRRPTYNTPITKDNLVPAPACRYSL